MSFASPMRWVSASTADGVFDALERATWTDFFEPPTPAKFTIVIVAEDEATWVAERARVMKKRGSTKAFSTPKGSTFTPNPLGKYAPVCLVFGDAMSAYTKCLSRQLGAVPSLRAQTEKLFHGVIPDDGGSLEQRNKNALSFVQSWATMQLVVEKGVTPVTAIGFSLGGLVMQWCHSPLTPTITTALAAADADSPLWKGDALCGQMNVLRRLWDIDDTVPTSDFFSAWLILDTDVDELVQSIDVASRVRVVVIESDRRCIIVGHPSACTSLAASRGIALTPFVMSLLAHCDWVPYDLAERAGMGYYNPEVNSEPAAKFAKQFAQMYTGCVDFRGQVRTAYDQGCRVFLEVGCDNKRTGAIQEILSERSDALALAMDGKVGDPKTQHCRVWAQLISHGFTLNTGLPVPNSPKSVVSDTFSAHLEVPLTPSTACLPVPC